MLFSTIIQNVCHLMFLVILIIQFKQFHFLDLTNTMWSSYRSLGMVNIWVRMGLKGHFHLLTQVIK